ncbi:MAG: iron ABC transporter permease, partial [Gemmatimonadales bacterium]
MSLRQPVRRLWWSIVPGLIAALVVVPMVLLVGRLMNPTGEVWAQLWSTILPEMIRNTLVLMLGVGVITFALGSGLAWLV